MLAAQRQNCCALQTRGAATGFCLRGGLHLTSLLFSLLNAARRRRKARLQSLREMLKESLRYTAFLGSFAGVYVAVDEGIAALFGKRRCASVACGAASTGCCGVCIADAAVLLRTSHWRAFVAGAAAGPSVLLTGCPPVPLALRKP